jgi:EAL domain-containing protein (putative c-di-GMP-specific phosphodiesterase class I)
VFEVVESDQIGENPQLQTTLEHYREAGFRVALDDVGAGYNSLNLLASIKPDFVKIDRGLVQGIEQDRYKAHVAAKLLELSRDLGVRSVVEGI